MSLLPIKISLPIFNPQLSYLKVGRSSKAPYNLSAKLLQIVIFFFPSTDEEKFY